MKKMRLKEHECLTTQKLQQEETFMEKWVGFQISMLNCQKIIKIFTKTIVNFLIDQKITV